jgi:hypothetical protein
MRAALLLALAVAGCNTTEFGLQQPLDPTPDMVGQDWSQDFRVAGAPTDILFYGDTSYSMRRELVKLGRDVQVFIDKLDQSASPWRLMAVTGPDGCSVDGVFDSETPDYAARFSSAIQTLPADDTQDEMGLQNVARAIEATVAGDCNEGFLRPDTTLHVIVLTDENDESPGFEGDPEYWRGYTARVIAAKGDDDVRFSAVAGPVPGGCVSAEAGTGYAEAVDFTGGEFLSICEDWVSQLDLLAELSVTQTTFALELPAEPDSIEVWIDEVSIPDRFSYDAAARAVVFEPAVAPHTNQTVRIDYVIAAE